MKGRPSDSVSISIAADEAALRVVRRLVGDDAGHRRAAVHVHRLVEYRVDRAGHVPHVVAADLAGGVGEPVGELARFGQQQQPRRLDRVAGDADDARLLPLLLAILVEIDDAVDLAGRVMLDPGGVAFGRTSRLPVSSPFGISV